MKAGFNHTAANLATGISVVSINYRFMPQAEADGMVPPVKGPLLDTARARDRGGVAEATPAKSRGGGVFLSCLRKR